MTPDRLTDAIERCIEKANRDSSRIQVDARAQLAALKEKVAELTTERDAYKLQFVTIAGDVRKILNTIGWTDEFIHSLYKIGVSRGVSKNA